MAESTTNTHASRPSDATPGAEDDEGTIMMPAAGAGDEGLSADDEIERMALDLVGEGASSREETPQGVATMMMPSVHKEERPGPKPVVIKGGPRRVVRADGRTPEIGDALGQRRFELSSGHEMFSAPKRPSKLIASVIGAAAIVGIIVVVIVAWHWSTSSLRLEAERSMVSSSSYSYALSLTPANDGGYYTAFFITSTPTTADGIGSLSRILLYRTTERPDRDSFSGAVAVSVPTNLAVSTTSSSNESTTASIADILANVGPVRSLTGIETAFSIRCYNVVITDEDHFAAISTLLDGSVPASSFDAESLLGHVCSNLSLDDLVAYAGKVGSATGGSITVFEAPTTPVASASGETLAAGSPDRFLTALHDAVAGVTPATTSGDVATTYDAEGNELSADAAATYEGQQYDAQGYPVGTHYNESGEPLLDENGNPVGTEYDENGAVVRDARGNMVIA